MEASRTSVIIPAWNAAASLERAIRSALSQDAGAPEIIVVDDGSTDATDGIASSFAPAVRLLRQPRRGLAAAANAGVRASTGDLIAVLDPGAEWLPSTSGALSGALREAPDAGFACCDAVEARGSGPPAARHAGSGAVESGSFEALLQHPSVALSATLMRADLVRRHDLRFAEALRILWDYDFLLRASRIRRFVRVEAPLVRCPEAPPENDALHLDRVLLFRRLRNDLRQDGGAGRRLMRIMERRLAESERILGEDRWRAGAYRASQDLFAASLRRAPSMRTLGMLVACMVGPHGRALNRKSLGPRRG